jgi:hypothetical protein
MAETPPDDAPTAVAPKPTPDGDSGKPGGELTRMGRFIQAYSGFLSSFVIGVAGLVATSIWQYRQSQIAARNAESEQAIAKTKAENDWRIARAEILAKNLNILASQAPDTADQRFGVLLSLTRGSILDPELAVSYALELGKVNPDYMRSVLSSTARKNYVQLEHAFALTCLQRFGVERAADICRDDKLADRSDAIALLVEDEIEASAQAGKLAEGPMALLHDEREVQARPGKLMWLFEPYLQDLYERRQWKEIAAFEAFSVGARLVAALVLATARTGEFITNVEQTQLERFHADRRKWLLGYMFARSCDPECRGKLVDVMLSTYGEAQGDYDESLQKLVQLSRAEAGPAVGKLHARLLWCQVDGDDLQEFRDRVLVPALARAMKPGKEADRTMLEDLVGLVALVPEPEAAPAEIGAPPDPAGAKALAAWRQMLDGVDKGGERIQRAFNVRRATARRERANPPPMIKKVNFCNAAATAGALPSTTP